MDQCFCQFQFRYAFTFGGGKISTETSYEVRYELTDAFTTISITDIVSTASVVMDFKSGGKGVAIGKVSETDNCFEVSEKWDVKVYGKLLSEYIKQAIGAIYPVGSIYMSVKNTKSNPPTLVGTWLVLGNRSSSSLVSMPTIPTLLPSKRPVVLLPSH